MSFEKARFQVRRLDDSWWNQIATLRQEAYQRFGDELKNPYFLTYGPTDRANANIAVIEGDQILSLLRIEKHLANDSLVFALQAEATPLRYPTAVLSRAATVDSYSKENLNMLLRQLALEAMIDAGYSDVFGTFKASARRSEFLESIGYELSSPTKTWNDFLQTDEPIRLAHLNLAQDGARAVQALENLTAATRKKFGLSNEVTSSLVREIIVFLESAAVETTSLKS